MKKVVIFGVGSLGQLSKHYIEDEPGQEVAAFTVNAAWCEPDQQVLGLDVVPFEELPARYPPEEFSVLVAIGYRKINRAREIVSAAAVSAGYELAQFASSKAQIGPGTNIASGCIVMPGATILPGASLGNGGIVWPGAYIGSSSQVGDWCYLAAQATICGNTRSGNGCFIGAGALIRDGINVADDCVIGMGAALQHGTRPGTVVKAPEPVVASYPPSEVKDFQ